MSTLKIQEINKQIAELNKERCKILMQMRLKHNLFKGICLSSDSKFYRVIKIGVLDSYCFVVSPMRLQRENIDNAELAGMKHISKEKFVESYNNEISKWEDK